MRQCVKVKPPDQGLLKIYKSEHTMNAIKRFQLLLYNSNNLISVICLHTDCSI